jgi:nitroreductase
VALNWRDPIQMSTPIDAVRPLTTTRQFRDFTTEPVTEDQLRAIAEAARWTGSGGNSQPWRFVIVRDRDVIKQISEAGMPQTRALATAPAIFAIALDDPESKMINAYDEGRLAERVLIAANMLGLGAGITWVRGEFRPAIQGLLGVGDDRAVRTILAIGHPTDSARAYRQEPSQARLSLDELVTWR